MTRRNAVWIIAGIITLAIVLVFLASGGDDDKGPDAAATPSVDLAHPSSDGSRVRVSLYFPDDHGLLSAEDRLLSRWSGPEEGARRLLEALIDGPRGKSLNAPLPAAVSLGPTHLSATSVLYVDLLSSELGSPPPTGSQMELMSVYSLVDTVILALPEIEAVVLLWNSRQPASFGGHVDTSLPLVADRSLIRAAR